jgi:hypothetical protein
VTNNRRLLKRVEPASQRVHAVWVAILAVALDRVVTLVYWPYEANSIVAGLGQQQWLIVTSGLMVLWAGCWYFFELHRLRIGYWIVGAVTVLHAVAVASNLLVVLTT